VLFLQQGANELQDANSGRPSDIAKFYRRSELSLLIISQFRIKLMPE